MSRVEQINSALLKELAELVRKNVYLENTMITLSYVECSPDLRWAKVGVSVLPDNLSEAAIKKLKAHGRGFSAVLRKKIKIRQIPKFNWRTDEREKHAAQIEEAIKNINK